VTTEVEELTNYGDTTKLHLDQSLKQQLTPKQLDITRPAQSQKDKRKLRPKSSIKTT
jgi:hypothetical protein